MVVSRALKRMLPLLAIGLGATVAQAHHSVGSFDMTRSIEIQGTVQQVQWTNPHSYVYMMVPSKSGAPEQWRVEVGVPNALVRDGWRKDTVKPGDKIHVMMAPKKDGGHEGALQSMTLSNGTKLKGFAADFLRG